MTSWSRCPAAPMLSRGRAPTRTRPPGVLVCLHLGLSASTGTPNADPDHKYLPPARPTHTLPSHQARRPSHSSPTLLSGCVRVCGREGGRVLGHAMHWPWNAAAIQRIGHTGAPAPLARLRTLRLLDRERRPGLQAHGRACICTTRHHRTLPPTTAVASVYAQHAHHRPTPHHHTPLHTTTTLDPGLSPWLQTPVNRPMDPPWRAPQPVPLGPASLPVRLRPCVCRAGAQRATFLAILLRTVCRTRLE